MRSSKKSRQAGNPEEQDPSRLLWDLAPVMALLVDSDGVIKWAGGAIRALSGFEPAEVIESNILDFIDTSWNPIALESIGIALAGSGLQRAMLFRLFRKDRSTFVAECQANSQWHDPAVAAMAVYVRRWDEQMLLNEVVEKLAAGAPIEETLELLTRVTGAETLEASGVAMLDRRRGRYRRSVTAFDLPEALRTDAEARGGPWTAATESGEPRWSSVGDLDEPLRQEAESAGFRWCWAWPVSVSGKVAGCLVLWRRADEQPDPTCTMLLDNLVRITGLVLEHERQERTLWHEATHDGLTRLANRAYLLDSVDDALGTSAGPLVGVLYVDLDRFKPVNDSLGHAVGDQVLKAVAKRLQSMVRVDDLVARIGGDEFVILCKAVDSAATLEKIAARISQVVCRPIAVGDHLVEVGASVGIAHTAPRSSSADALIAAADSALYAVKESGRGGFSTAVPS